MKINSVSFTNSKHKKQSYINSKITGYTATAGIGLAVITGFSKNRNIRKAHKFLAALASIATIWHIYSVRYNKKLFKSIKN